MTRKAPPHVILLGAGGHARVLLEALRSRRIEVLGATVAEPGKKGERVAGVEILGDDSAVRRYPQASTILVNGIGSVDVATLRKSAFDRLKDQGYLFMTVVHPSAIVAEDSKIEEGAQLLAGAIVQTGARIGTNAIVNTGASVDHDCDVGAHAHIAPGVTLSGGVRIGEGSHVGTGAVVVQGIRIGARCLVAAGAVVVRDVADEARVAGVPAKAMRK